MHEYLIVGQNMKNKHNRLKERLHFNRRLPMPSGMFSLRATAVSFHPPLVLFIIHVLRRLLAPPPCFATLALSTTITAVAAIIASLGG